MYEETLSLLAVFFLSSQILRLRVLYQTNDDFIGSVKYEIAIIFPFTKHNWRNFFFALCFAENAVISIDIPLALNGSRVAYLFALVFSILEYFKEHVSLLTTDKRRTFTLKQNCLLRCAASDVFLKFQNL